MSRRSLSAAILCGIASLSALSIQAASAQTGPAQAASAAPGDREADGFAQMFTQGTVGFDLRARYESVDEARFPEDARAGTLRSRVGFSSASWNGFSFLVEGADVRELLDDYNSTANGKTRHPVVLDPEGSEFNQAWLRFAPGKRFSATVGRQRIQLDNQRHFGSASFRQHEQTFDALQMTAAPTDKLAVRYAYLDKVNRVPGKGHPLRTAREQALDGHLLNVGLKTEAGTLVGYGYFVENEDLPLQSTKTLGLRFSGAQTLSESFGKNARFEYTLEWATQNPYADGARTLDNDYRLVEAAYTRPTFTARLGHETLGGNRRAGFQTPFATLFAFNGWADRFLTTPADGLRDAYVGTSVKVAGGDLAFRYHDFRSDRGDRRYGDEIDLRYSRNLTPQWLAAVQYARFDSRAAQLRDARKIWLTLEWKYQHRLDQR
jgi:Alginate export